MSNSTPPPPMQEILSHKGIPYFTEVAAAYDHTAESLEAMLQLENPSETNRAFTRTVVTMFEKADERATLVSMKLTTAILVAKMIGDPIEVDTAANMATLLDRVSVAHKRIAAARKELKARFGLDV